MRNRTSALAAVAALLALLAGCDSDDGQKPRARARPEPPAPVELAPEKRPADPRPNIVFVLTDDLSWNLVEHMPNVKRLQRRGVTFSHYFVTDSLCCPSRASILTGRLPHNTKIFTNTPPDGGFRKFRRRGEERFTFATALRRAGYATAMMGKYMNGYMPLLQRRMGFDPYVPPGWSEWDVAGNGYREYDYALNENGTIVQYGHEPEDYMTDVLAEKGVDFIGEEARAGRPFLLELSTFAPHAPFTPAPRDRGRFNHLRAPRTPAFNRRNVLPPTWLDVRRKVPPLGIELVDRAFRKRVRSVQAVDRMLGRVQDALKDAGVARKTYVIFSSDNGFHLGDHRLLPGKLTAFDSDIRVPLVVAGPDVPKGRTVKKLAANIDLAPTFAGLARTRMTGPVDGRSLARLFHGNAPGRWRRGVLIEHVGPVNGRDDPDAPRAGVANPPSYEAVRTAGELYVEYETGEAEYYDLRRDPFQLDNRIDLVPEHRIIRLHSILRRLARCRRGHECSASARRG
ncbi:MAG TPA: sulfatase [Thermoleophilaceae bacterium]|nr:sulfatase [Thermoleophilaceae bacterium]